MVKLLSISILYRGPSVAVPLASHSDLMSFSYFQRKRYSRKFQLIHTYRHSLEYCDSSRNQYVFAFWCKLLDFTVVQQE